MRAHWLISWSILGFAGACGMDAAEIEDDDYTWASDPKADGASGVNIAATDLQVDVTALTGVATIELEKNGHVALEVGGLEIASVHDKRGKRKYKIVDGKLLVTNVRGPIEIAYSFAQHDNADGLLPGGSTVIWPYHCGNLFPCHSQPADGTTFTLAMDGVPAGKTAIYPEAIETEAPPYMLAWAIGKYGSAKLGNTTAGTEVAVHWLPSGESAARRGTKHLVGVFDWFETTLGPYAFGDRVAAVSVVWGEGLYGGMEHHPYWHVAKDAMADEETQAHEAAHGWYGDGVRLRCWEDFVLSEGTTSYLAARALTVVAGATKGEEVWASYQDELDAAIAEGGSPAWPRGCNEIDIVADKLFTNLPYMQGAFFYKDVADVVGADVLDGVLGRFYQAHVNEAAGMQDMIDAIIDETGFDPTAIAEARLRTRF